MRFDIIRIGITINDKWSYEHKDKGKDIVVRMRIIHQIIIKFIFILSTKYDMGLSENSVPLNPMVNDHYPY